jgi:hypothetical protein
MLILAKLAYIGCALYALYCYVAPILQPYL